jgi:hypothetical protein
MLKTFTILAAIFIANILIVFARSSNVSQLPNGSKFSCNTCHTNGSTSSLNKFGQEVKKSYYTGHNVNWVSALAKLDSDGDGTTNGQELLDTDGIWKIGFTNPGSTDDVTNPGDEKSKPTSVWENSNNLLTGALKIYSIFPNPVINRTIVSYELKNSDFVSINLYDYNGNIVKNLFNGFINSGIHNFLFDATQNKDISQGSYLIVIQSGSNTVIEKLVVF